MKSILRTFALATFSGVVTALTASGAALAITENAYNYATPKIGHYAISHLAMVPNSEGGDYLNSASGNGLSTVAGARCFTAGVNLPNGATIKNLIVFHAADAAGRVEFTLLRQRISDGGNDTIGTRTSTSTTGQRVTKAVPIDASLAVVTNSQYLYGVNLCINNVGGVFYGARIGYTYTSAGD
jgi:hypothetical protein